MFIQHFAWQIGMEKKPQQSIDCTQFIGKAFDKFMKNVSCVGFHSIFISFHSFFSFCISLNSLCMCGFYERFCFVCHRKNPQC